MTIKELCCRCLGFIAEAICRDQRNDCEICIFFREQCESQKYYSPSCRNFFFLKKKIYLFIYFWFWFFFFLLLSLKSIWCLKLDENYHHVSSIMITRAVTRRVCSHSCGSYVKSRKCYLNVLRVAILTKVYCSFNRLMQKIVSWHAIISLDVFFWCSEIWAHCGYNNNNNKIHKWNLNKYLNK